jgi:hypothetical protein
MAGTKKAATKAKTSKPRVRRPPPPPLPVESLLVKAVELMQSVTYLEDLPYLRAYSRISGAFVGLPVMSWYNKPDPDRRKVRELTYFPSETAIRWIDRIRDKNLLAAVLATAALDRLSNYADILGAHRRYDFPESRDKAELTSGARQYWIEFEVPEWGRYELRDEVLEPGHRGVALVERCHLSSSFYHTSCGQASVRGHGECRPLLGFDVPCRVTNLCRFEGDSMITDHYDMGGGMYVGGDMLVGTYGTTCEIPFSFITGARREDFDRDRDHRFPLSPNLGLDAMAKLILEVAEEVKNASAAEAPG